MTHASVTLNGQTLLAGDIHHWAKQPPQFLHELADRQPGRRREPWQMCVGGVLAQAILLEQAITITVTTHLDGWTMDVNTSDRAIGDPYQLADVLTPLPPDSEPRQSA